MESIESTYKVAAPADALTPQVNPQGKAWLGPLLIFLFLAAFYLLERLTGPLQWVHWLFLGSVGGCYFFSLPTRTLVVIGIPVVAYATLYDFFQFIPFENLLPIHIESVYRWDEQLFGLSTTAGPLLFHEWVYQSLKHPLWDFVAGIFYLLHIPAVIALILYFWRRDSINLAQKFTLAFFVLNVFAFLTYYLLPAAAPWYVEKFGFVQPLGPIPGDPAGLIHFEKIVGLSFFSDNYSISPVVFGAIPSMHAGFATLGWLYSLQSKRWLTVFMTLYILGMYFSALYLQHHYLIDVVWGMAYALLAWFLMEKLFKKPAEKINQALRRIFIRDAYRPILKNP